MEYVAVIMIWGTLSGSTDVNISSRPEKTNIIRDSKNENSNTRIDVRLQYAQKN